MPRISSPLRPDWQDIPRSEFRDQYKQLASLKDLAEFWGVKPYQLSYYAFIIDKKAAYSTFTIPRRNGRERRIEAPLPTLKYIQRLIHESLTHVYGPHQAVHGFRTGRSIVTNARNHLGRRYVLNVDLEDFFPSIIRRRIYGRLIAEPYALDSGVAHLISNLSTNAYGRLPQGSPSSPVIANIIASKMDTDLANLCSSLYCRYTRYADDITISTSRSVMSPHIARYPNALGTGQVIIGDRLTGIIENNGFKLNHRKSRLQSNWTRQLCTGLVVNDGDSVSPPRSYIRRLRSLVHHWKKNGWQDAANVLLTKENRPPDRFKSRESVLNHVVGRISYLKMVRGEHDPIALRLESIVGSLPKDH